ncbi:dimethyl sulfoxide reductase anchor subunit family protein [Acetonema longum]|uniref:Anaerobic dimethyl sulfoxide reductase subunit C n=1 Tax=Acetonema longum DSM 6540 TaxID=1009370 RepID=F7NJR9_9FIRM|nr:DmsC/YnfH family molybdoenzyme membrane anchor subunit [Acetonema longum]EGO63725.1 anaerobic dimethyl sulfoxide reductase subunit C [Acetonema longum DSM 6540]
MKHEWPLVVFTLLSQASIGLFLAHQILNGERRLAITSILRWVIVLMGIAMGTSLMHLGSPLAAYGAVANIGTSWLSREIFFSGGFFGLVIVCYFLEKQGLASAGMNRLAGWAAALAGALCLISTACTYIYTAVAAWSTFYTHIAFYTTAAILGLIGYAVLLWQLPQEQEQPTVPAALAGISASVVLQLTGMAAYLVFVNGAGLAQQSIKLLYDQMSLFIAGQLLAVGSIASMFRFHKKYRMGSADAKTWLQGTFAMILLSAIIGRYLFYGIGVPFIGKF